MENERVILVVDDDADIREAVQSALEDEGFTVACVADGAAALAYLASAPRPCMILLDLMMPVMDGWAFREAQKKDPQHARICTAVMTAFQNLKDRKVEADHFIFKPLHLDDLLKIVDACCGAA